MTEKDEKLLAEFELKMRQLMYFCDTLKDENRSLKQQLDQKENKIEALSLEVEQLEKKYNNLKFVKSIGSSDQDEMQQAKRKLSKLVRDVDKCIAMLKS